MSARMVIAAALLVASFSTFVFIGWNSLINGLLSLAMNANSSFNCKHISMLWRLFKTFTHHREYGSVLCFFFYMLFCLISQTIKRIWLPEITPVFLAVNCQPTHAGSWPFYRRNFTIVVQCLIGIAGHADINLCYYVDIHVHDNENTLKQIQIIRDMCYVPMQLLQWLWWILSQSFLRIHMDFHLTCTMLLHYLVKFENPKK